MSATRRGFLGTVLGGIKFAMLGGAIGKVLDSKPPLIAIRATRPKLTLAQREKLKAQIVECYRGIKHPEPILIEHVIVYDGQLGPPNDHNWILPHGVGDWHIVELPSF